MKRESFCRLPLPHVAFLAWMLAVAWLVPACAQEEYKKFFPEPDPFVGDWVGRWSEDVKVDPAINAQIIALGGNEYRLRFVAMLDRRATPKAIVDAEAKDGVIAFEGGGMVGEVRPDGIRGTSKSGKSSFQLRKTVRLSPTLGKEPPDGADVLYDGNGFEAWETPKGWVELEDGAMMVVPKGARYLESKKTYTDLEMHVEFRTSFMPDKRGQERANSGVFIQDVYEVQVLDSYGLEGYYDECGALYKLSAPRVNACAPPLQWQTYDIEYTAPRYENGELAANGRITVYHNGVLIQDDVRLEWITAWTEAERNAPPPKEAGKIRLQPHGNYTQYRNIWVVDER